MVRLQQPFVAVGLLLHVATASPRVEASVSTWEHGTTEDRTVRREIIIPRYPKAPMIRRNGLVAREETKSFSLDQTLENEQLFNRYTFFAQPL
jgi:hypothetical protein